MFIYMIQRTFYETVKCNLMHFVAISQLKLKMNSCSHGFLVLQVLQDKC